MSIGFLIVECPPVQGTTAEQALREQVRIHPDSFQDAHALGEYYAHRSDLKQAVPWLRRAYALDPTSYDNGYDLALALLQIKLIPEARRVVHEMLARKETSELHNLLGAIEDADGKIIDGVRQYEAAARMDPSEKNVFDLGSDLLNHQGFGQAIAIFEFGIAHYPNSSKMRVGLGIAYYSSGRYKDAVDTLCKAADLDPSDVRALGFLGKMIDVSPELTDELAKRLARFVQMYPNNAAANYYYALSVRSQIMPGTGVKEAGEVEARLRKAVTLDPGMAEAHYQLGLLYQNEKQADKAIREFETVIRLRPAFKAAHYHLARLYDAEGKQKLAGKEFQIVRTLPN